MTLLCHTSAMVTPTVSGPAPSLLPHLWKSTLVSGVLAVLLGIAVVAWPGISILIAAIFFGAYLLVTGIAQVVLAFSLRAPSAVRCSWASAAWPRWYWACCAS